MTMNPNSFVIAADDYVTFGFASTASDTLTTIDAEFATAPFVATNIATRYEAWATITDGTNTHVMTDQFTINASAFHGDTALTQICGDYFDFTIKAKIDFNLA